MGEWGNCGLVWSSAVLITLRKRSRYNTFMLENRKMNGAYLIGAYTPYNTTMICGITSLGSM